jgi:hypothetical protein
MRHVKSPASSTINQGRCHHSMHGHFIPPPHCAPNHFFLSVKSPSLTAAYAPAKKPMKLEPIVMIHGGSISDTTPMSMSRACSTAPPIVPPSQKTIQRTRMSVDCRATFIAAPKRSGPRIHPQAARCGQPDPPPLLSFGADRGAYCALNRISWACQLGGSNSSTQIADMALSRPMTVARMFLSMSTISRPQA